MAEHTFAMLLALTRQIPAVVDAQRRTEWIHASASRQRRPTEIRGRTLGIVGWGKIADGVAHLARAFGMRVIGTRRSVEVPREMPRDGCGAYDNPPWLEPVDLPPDIVYPASQLHEVLAQSDIVLLVLPLTAETERSIGRAEFQTMRRGSILLNIGRGQVVDEEALVDALRAGRIGAAGLDVFQEEPLPRSSPLWSMPNVLISPHIGGVSDRTAERGAALFAANLSRYLQGHPLLNVVERDQGY
jgi:phosphoglycerate dehydrogenase-like enzyme